MSTPHYEYVVLDLETTVNSSRDFNAAPFDPVNAIVVAGLLTPQEEVLIYDFQSTDDTNKKNFFDAIHNTDLIIGQNVGFDLHYIRKNMPFINSWYEWINTIAIWDTQIAEYLLSGHKHKFESLDSLSEKYGGNLKNDAIKTYWDSGIKTEDIPMSELCEYLKWDLINTYTVFKGQYKKVLDVNDKQFTKVLAVQMEHRLVTLEMEYNGMFFNQALCSNYLEELQNEIDELTKSISNDMDKHLGYYVVSNPLSNKQVATILYGGYLQYDDTEPVMNEYGEIATYKTGLRAGQFKEKKVKRKEWIDGVLSARQQRELEDKNTSNSTLKAICEMRLYREHNAYVTQFCESILALRKLNKDASTYFEGYSKECWEHDSCLHPTYNHASTSTGRISCTKPNVMNITRKET